MPETSNTNKERMKQITDESLDAPVQADNSADEAYEYFSDKEEAEKYKKTQKQNPPIL